VPAARIWKKENKERIKNFSGKAPREMQFGTLRRDERITLILSSSEKTARQLLKPAWV
jgi:hypothetical protein